MKMMRLGYVWLICALAAVLCIAAACSRKDSAAIASPSPSSEVTWLTDFKQAQQQADADKKLLLVDFTGSDWCGWCMRLRQEVFSQPAFKQYAAEKLVLVEVDFPRQRPQSTEVKLQNQELAQRFGVQGFPTILVLDAKGRTLGRLGYMQGGAVVFISAIEDLRG